MNTTSQLNTRRLGQRAIERYLPLVGRLLIAAIFLWSGWRKLGMPGPVIGQIASSGMPHPEIGYALSLLAELGAGSLLVLGLQTRLAAAGLAVFTLAAALMFHANWAQPPQVVNFMKNIAMIGGMAQVVAFGAGPISLDALRAKRRATSGRS